MNLLRVLPPLLLVPCLALAAAGDLDPAFGTGGMATISIATPTGSGLSGVGLATPSQVLVQPDGRILVVAMVIDSNVNANRNYSVVARFNADGTPDATFGNAGVSLTDLTGFNLEAIPSRIALQPDGKILVTGTAGSITVNKQGMYLARLNADGTPDTGFPGAISAPMFLEQHGTGHALILEPGGKVVVIGSREQPSSIVRDVFIARFLANGTIDTTFGASGVALPGIAEPGLHVRSAARQQDGSIVAAFFYGIGGYDSDFALFRITANGALDTPFGIGGITYTDFSGGYDYAEDLALLPDGRIAVAGTASATTDPGNPSRVAAVAVYTTSGVLDASFGNAGKRTVSIGSPGSTFKGIAVMADGRMVVAGSANDPVWAGDSADVALYRFLPDGSPDPNFAGTGGFMTDLGGGEWAASVALQADGKIVAPIRRSGGQLSVARYDGGNFTIAVTTSSANPVLMVEPVSFTARVFGLSPTGTVTFRRAGTDIPGCVDVALVSGSAPCPGVVLPGGAHAITAAYSGDGDDPAVVSPAFVQYVLSPATDVDDDGIPDLVETIEATNPIVKDNDVFTGTPKGARLFTMQVYRDFLAREGDANGINFYAGILAAGNTSREQILDTFLRAPEFEGFVAPAIRLYFATFSRIPDYEGLQFHVAALRGGATLAGIAWNFTLAQEFQATYGTLDDTQFVTLLYQNVLGRTATQPEIDFHVARLASGTTRGEVLIGFSESPEFRAYVANDVFATMMYAGMLRRTPETAGFAYWLALLDAGAPRLFVIRGFLYSSEYRARFLP